MRGGRIATMIIARPMQHSPYIPYIAPPQFPLKFARSRGMNLDFHATHYSLGPPYTLRQTASLSSLPFFHDIFSRSLPTNRQTAGQTDRTTRNSTGSNGPLTVRHRTTLFSGLIESRRFKCLSYQSTSLGGFEKT